MILPKSGVAKKNWWLFTIGWVRVYGTIGIEMHTWLTVCCRRASNPDTAYGQVVHVPQLKYFFSTAVLFAPKIKLLVITLAIICNADFDFQIEEI